MSSNAYDAVKATKTQAAMPLPDDTLQEITDALLAGRSIQAIKVYRAATGSSLTEAKQFMDGLTEELRKEHPDKFPEKKTIKVGCAGVFIFFVAVLATTILLTAPR